MVTTQSNPRWSAAAKPSCHREGEGLQHVACLKDTLEDFGEPEEPADDTQNTPGSSSKVTRLSVRPLRAAVVTGEGEERDEERSNAA